MNNTHARFRFPFDVVWLYDNKVAINSGSLFFHSSFSEISSNLKILFFETASIEVSSGDTIYLKVTHTDRSGETIFSQFTSAEISTEFQEDNEVTCIKIAEIQINGEVLTIDQFVFGDIHIAIPGTKDE